MPSLRLGSKIPCLLLVPPYLMMPMSVVMKANPEDVWEVVRFAKDAIVTEVVIANEADDTVQAVADSVGGATRRRGSEAVHQGARVPQRSKAKEKPEVIFYYLKSART